MNLLSRESCLLCLLFQLRPAYPMVRIRVVARSFLNCVTKRLTTIQIVSSEKLSCLIKIDCGMCCTFVCDCDSKNKSFFQMGFNRL